MPKPKRRTISKALRFEVFKRDSFACIYCGKAPPSVTLEIDHINPCAKKGTNDINNLATSCFDCNRGKRDIPLSKIPAKLKYNLDRIKEQELQVNEYNKYLKKIRRRENKAISIIDNAYNDQYEDYRLSESFKHISLKRFLKKLTCEEILNALYIAISKFPEDKDHVIKYFCGICWKKIKNSD